MSFVSVSGSRSAVVRALLVDFLVHADVSVLVLAASALGGLDDRLASSLGKLGLPHGQQDDQGAACLLGQPREDRLEP